MDYVALATLVVLLLSHGALGGVPTGDSPVEVEPARTTVSDRGQVATTLSVNLEDSDGRTTVGRATTGLSTGWMRVHASGDRRIPWVVYYSGSSTRQVWATHVVVVDAERETTRVVDIPDVRLGDAGCGTGCRRLQSAATDLWLDLGRIV